MQQTLYIYIYIYIYYVIILKLITASLSNFIIAYILYHLNFFFFGLPVWFCVIFFATIIVFLERLFKEDHELMMNKGTQSSHVLQLAHYAFVNLGYFIGVIFFQWRAAAPSSVLSNANKLHSRLNFELIESESGYQTRPEAVRVVNLNACRQCWPGPSGDHCRRPAAHPAYAAEVPSPMSAMQQQQHGV